MYRGAGRERIHNIADKKDVRLVTSQYTNITIN